MSLQRGINLRSLAEKMGQCSGAEVRGICTEAGGCTTCCFCFRRSSFSPDLFFLRKLTADLDILRHLLGMYALRERRQHVTQEDFEFAVAKVRIRIPRFFFKKEKEKRADSQYLHVTGSQKELRGQHVCQQTVFVILLAYSLAYPVFYIMQTGMFSVGLPSILVLDLRQVCSSNFLRNLAVRSQLKQTDLNRVP